MITRKRDKGVKLVSIAAREAIRISHFWLKESDEEKMMPLTKERLGNQMAMTNIATAVDTARSR